jgi:glyoxylase-like metal-dependent hydrolase (beta-lactamase superfamily II)
MIKTAFPQISAIPVLFPGDIGSSMAYLVKGKTNTMVDSGPKQFGENSLIRELNEAGILLKDVSHVLLTHGHADHIGGTYLLHIAGASVAVGEADRCYLENHIEAFIKYCKPIQKLLGKSAEEINAVYDGFMNELPEEIVPDVLIEDGALYELGGSQFRAIAVPGHTPGGFAFLHENDGALLAGDNIAGYGIPGGGIPQIWDLPSYADSLRKLLEIQTSGILSAHPYYAPGMLPATERKANEVVPFIAASIEFTDALMEIVQRYSSRKGDPLTVVADEIIAAMPSGFGYVPLEKQGFAADMTLVTIASALRGLAGW